MNFYIFTTFVFIFHTFCGSLTDGVMMGVGEDPRSNNRFAANKTVKILTGQQRPPQSHLQPPAPPMNIQNGNGYYPPMQNHYPSQSQYPQYPQSPPDLSPQPSGVQPSVQKPDDGGVPQAYVQIIGAIEKLVGRMDNMDKRMLTLENIVLHLSNKETPKQGNCPDNFVKVEGIRGKCFHISTLGKEHDFQYYDWKSAHAACRKMGGRLTEMVHYEDFLRISQFLIKYGAPRNLKQSSADYWIGGINPGLIWIWSESGQKVGMDGKFWNENDNSSNAPGCLKLSFSHRLDSFFFKGAPCSHSQNILCEVMDNSVARALALFEEELNTIPSSNSTKAI